MKRFLKGLEKDYTPSPYGIPPKPLKRLAEEINYLLFYLFEVSLGPEVSGNHIYKQGYAFVDKENIEKGKKGENRVSM